jgi:hypothetical protein
VVCESGRPPRPSFVRQAERQQERASRYRRSMRRGAATPVEQWFPQRTNHFGRNHQVCSTVICVFGALFILFVQTWSAHMAAAFLGRHHVLQPCDTGPALRAARRRGRGALFFVRCFLLLNGSSTRRVQGWPHQWQWPVTASHTAPC